jgi:hypothetical protein
MIILKSWIILRVKFHVKYITHIILNDERETILYEFLDSRRWKDLNKINGVEKWWCGMLENFKNETLFMY